MANLDELVKLKDYVERLRREADQAQGALDQALSRLQSEHGCDSVEAAEEKLKVGEAKLEGLRRAYESGLAQFKKDFPDVC